MGQRYFNQGQSMKFGSDVDIDFGDRTQALGLLKHTPASILRDGQLVPHNTGIYVTGIPQDPFTGAKVVEPSEALSTRLPAQGVVVVRPEEAAGQVLTVGPYSGQEREPVPGLDDLCRVHVEQEEVLHELCAPRGAPIGTSVELP